MKSSVNDLLTRFIALPCWAVVAGKGTGSMVSLAFGNKIPRDSPLTNNKLADDYRHNTSDYSIFLEHASWLLEKGDLEICSCHSDNSNDGVMVNTQRSNQ